MKKILFYSFLSLAFFNATKARSQTIDTLVDVGGYKLHFNIIKGTGTPILFEAGGGDDATTWKNIIKPIADLTKTTLIAYDRAGFGKSSFDTTKHGILNGVIGLENGLRKLGYTGDIILVAHSQGGLYATLFAFRNPDKVKAAVLIDATTSCFYEVSRLAATQQIIDAQNKSKANLGSYYQGADFSSNINFVRDIVFPKTIPVTDFVSDYTPFTDKKEVADWKKCHHEFVAESANRTGITAYGCGHFIFEDNPPLVINAIVRAFSTTLNRATNNDFLKGVMDYNVNAANNIHKVEVAYRHSANDLRSWGNELLEQGRIKHGLDVFKLSTELNPDNWRVYDSYAAALLKNGQKEDAIKMYRKSIELNPKNEKGKKVLEDISKP
jgi:pimeloyl-ACP methyl ester carboxylesterase